MRVGNHLKHCPERQDRENGHLLSQKTIQKRETKCSKAPCPKCGKLFGRLDTHLDSTFCFLGAPVSLHDTNMQARAGLLEKLRGLLQKVDATMVTQQQKLKLFKVAICPCLTWDLSVSDFHSYMASDQASTTGYSLPQEVESRKKRCYASLKWT